MSEVNSSLKSYSHLELFNHVAEYAVDTMGYRRDLLAEQHMLLTPEVFYEHLYVARPKAEEELRTAIQESAHYIVVLGRGGGGKTSLVTKVLEDLKPEQKGLVFRFDFKAIADNERVEAHRDEEKLAENLGPTFREEVMTKLKEFVNDTENLTLDDLVGQLARDGNHSYEPDIDTVNVRFELHTQFDRQRRSGKWKGSFNDWLEHQIQKGAEPVVKLLDGLTKNLTPKTFLQALVTVRKPQAVNKAILLFDNIDSIQSKRLRDAFRQFARSYTNNVGEYAKVIVCLRPENIERNLDRSLRENAPPDVGAFIYEYIDLDKNYDVSVKREASGHNMAAMDRGMEGDAPDPEDPRVQFSQAIIAKRFDYLDWCVRDTKIPVRDAEKLQTLRRRCAFVLEIGHVQNTLSRLTNFDIRAMQVMLANFVEDLDKHTDTHLEKIEHDIHRERNSDRRKRFIGEWENQIESHLYFFIANMGNSSNSPFDPNLYNIAKWVASWQSKEKTAVALMASRLALTCLYNEADIKGKQKSRVYNLVTTSQIVEQCERIGIKRADTSANLQSFCDEMSARRFVETSNPFAVASLDQKKWEEEKLAPTPRTQLLLEVMELKFHFLLALMRREEIVLPGQEQPFQFDPQNSVTPATIGAVLQFICLVGRMELEMLDNVKLSPFAQDKPGWLNDFRDEFCVYQAMPSNYDQIDLESYYKDGRGNLQTDNLFVTSLRFLATLHRHGYFNRVVQHEMLAEYDRVRKTFNSWAIQIAAGRRTALIANLNNEINTAIFKKD